MKLPPESENSDWNRVRKHDIEQTWDASIAPHSVASYSARIRFLVSEIEKRIPTGGRVLDVGCASGTLGLTLAERGYTVALVDGCAGYLDYARARYERGNVRFYTGYFDRKFPLEDPFDVVVCTEVLEHVREPSKLLGCLRDKACDGGVVLLTTPNADYFRFRLPSFTGATQEAIDSLVANSKDGEEHRYFFTREEVLTLMRGVGMKIAGSGFFLPVWLTGEMKFRWLHRCSFRLRGKPLMLSGLPPKGVRWCARYLCASQWFVGTRT